MMEEGTSQIGRSGLGVFDARSLRSRGDRARDERNWAEAATAYRDYLRRVPRDAGIWAQLGHCLRESGGLEDAEAAYRRGLAMAPNDADLQFHLGHVLALSDRVAEATTAFRRAYDLYPTKGAYDELLRLNLPVPDAQPIPRNGDGESRRLLLEIGDLLMYARRHNTLSGIQRVQMGVIKHVLERMKTDAAGYAFVFGRTSDCGLWHAHPEHVRRLVDYLSGDALALERQIALVSYIEHHSVPLRPVAGQCYFLLGAFWAWGSDGGNYTRLKELGVVTGALIYDLIPLTHPEFVLRNLTNEFMLSIGDGFAAFDFILTISEDCAETVRRFRERHGLRSVPIRAVPLAHLLQDEPTPAADWCGPIARLKDRPFVLYVSSLEPRKNHVYLFNVWKHFLAQGLDPPDLVFVGRYGWRIGDFKEALEATNYLDGRIHVLHGLSDGELTRLYQSCLFTVFPSFVEGWGLPVGESLAHGRVCVASKVSSIPEVGGDLVDYIDPYNVRDGIAVLGRMLSDAGYRQGRERDLRARFVTRTWSDVSRDLLAAVTSLRTVEVERRAAPLLDPGELFLPGDLRAAESVPASYPARPLRPILAEGWHPAEPRGAHLRGVEGILRFRTGLASATEVAVYIALFGSPRADSLVVAASIGGGAAPSESRDAPNPAFPPRALNHGSRLPARANRVIFCHALGPVGRDGVVELRVRLEGAPTDDAREHWVALAALAYAEAGDARLRALISESLACRDYHNGSSGGNGDEGQ